MADFVKVGGPSGFSVGPPRPIELGWSVRRPFLIRSTKPAWESREARKPRRASGSRAEPS